MAYLDKLKDRRWQRKRLEIMQRDNWICTQCRNSDNSVQLHVHHKKYGWKDYFKRIPADPWECLDADLVSLCEPCHSNHHGETPRKPSPKKTAAERICYGLLLRGREVGETQATFEAKRQKVLDDIRRIESGVACGSP